MDDLLKLQTQARLALAGAFIGTGWIFWGTAFLPAQKALWSTLAAITAALVLTGSISRVRVLRRRVVALKTSAISPASESSSRLGLAFFSVVALELLLASASAIFFAATHRPDGIPIAIALIVGLHFLPLARILALPSLNPIGIAIIVIALASLAIPAPTLRNVIACSGIGLFMWAKAIIALRATRLHVDARVGACKPEDQEPTSVVD